LASYPHAGVAYVIIGRMGWDFRNVSIIFKNSALTAKKAQLFTVTKINRLTLFKEIIAVYSKNRTKHTNTLRGKVQCFQNSKETSGHW
jgi:hypothetical protein